VGKSVQFRGKAWAVQDLATFDFSRAQIGLFSAGASVSAVHAPRAGKAGCVVIDNTSQFRYPIVEPQPLDLLIVHPPISIGPLVGLYNSTNSSPAVKPLARNSLITTFVAACFCGAALTGTRTTPVSPVNRQASRKTNKNVRIKAWRDRIRLKR
jgi:hypothetical protein